MATIEITVQQANAYDPNPECSTCLGQGVVLRPHESGVREHATEIACPTCCGAASVQIVEHKKGARLETALRRAQEIFPTARVTAKKIEHARSRAQRLAEAERALDSARSEIESLRDEMGDWYDNMPDNLQSSDKGDQVGDARDRLEEIMSALEDVSLDVEFPSMY